MKAIRIHQYGNADVLQQDEIPIPAIKDDELLIRVHAAGINPVDWKIREGYMKDSWKHQLPLIIGWDASGEVTKTGARVRAFKPGDQVFAFTSLFRGGTNAEYIVAKESEVAIKPANLDDNHAAAVPLAALTAWQAMFDKADIKAGQTVLIHAAAGGVGHFAVQLAKCKGARVLGTASTSNREFLAKLGVDEMIDYNNPHWEKYKGKIDMVLDTVGGKAQEISWPLLKPNGILITIVDPSRVEAAARQYGVRGAFLLVEPNNKELQQIAALIEQGKLVPYISEVLPFTEVKKAHELSQAGHVRGKIVLNFMP